MDNKRSRLGGVLRIEGRTIGDEDRLGHQFELPDLLEKAQNALKTTQSWLDSTQGQLVVAVRQNGSLHQIATLQEWRRREVPVPLLQRVYSVELLILLKKDLGIVEMDDNGHLSLRFVLLPDSSKDSGTNTTRLLGRIAEALIVSQCRQDRDSNRLWAKFARQGQRIVSTPDKFMAVGTGLGSTRDDPALFPKYFLNDPQRDIVWVRKDNFEQTLLSAGTNRTGGRAAGLQVKVSRNGHSYVLPDLLRKRYEVPVVYFDLNKDFDRIVERDFVHGKAVDVDIHEKLLDFAPIVAALLDGRITADRLIDAEVGTALVVTGLEEKGETPLVLAQ